MFLRNCFLLILILLTQNVHSFKLIELSTGLDVETRSVDWSKANSFDNTSPENELSDELYEVSKFGREKHLNI